MKTPLKKLLLTVGFAGLLSANTHLFAADTKTTTSESSAKTKTADTSDSAKTPSSPMTAYVNPWTGEVQWVPAGCTYILSDPTHPF